jgi:hypothetical protein
MIFWEIEDHLKLVLRAHVLCRNEPLFREIILKNWVYVLTAQTHFLLTVHFN